MRANWARLCSIVFTTMLLTAACVDRDPGGAGAEPTDEPASPTTAPEAGPAPHLLDLRTGETKPLPIDLGVGLYVTSPDGTMIAHSTYSVLYGSPNDVLTIANIDGTDAREIPVPGGLNGYAMEWSPDGTALLYHGREGGTEDVGNLFLYDLAADQSTRVTQIPMPVANWNEIHTDLSPDGRQVLFHVARNYSAERPKFDVWSVPVRGGELRIVVRDAAFPMYILGGEEIAFVVPSPGGYSGRRIEILGADGSRRTLVAGEDISRPQESPDGTRIAYTDTGSIYVIDVSTGDVSEVAVGEGVEWVDDDTLIVAPE
jgi:Tol biopolymer transport system component